MLNMWIIADLLIVFLLLYILLVFIISYVLLTSVRSVEYELTIRRSQGHDGFARRDTA